ncbi:MAG: DMT family transporter [Candidatus Bathyarchaeia archaeon]
MNMIGELAALAAALCWTLSPVLYKLALSDAKPIPANISRCISTTVFLVACVGISGKLWGLTTLATDSLLLASLSGVVGLCLGDTLYILSLALIGVSRTVPISCAYPLFTTFFATLFLGEHVTPFLLLGTVVIIMGVWLVSQEGVQSSDTTRSTLFRGVLVALAAAVVWSVSIILMDHALELSQMATVDSALVVNTVRMLATTLLFLALSPLIDRRFSFMKLKRKTWIILALGGIIALGLGWVLLAVSLSQIEASRAVPISSVSPLFATIIGAFFLKEKVTVRIFIGSVLIVLGTSVIFVM